MGVIQIMWIPDSKFRPEYRQTRWPGIDRPVGQDPRNCVNTADWHRELSSTVERLLS
jgi:hypothetical protein